MRLIKVIKFAYGDESRIVRMRSFYVYESITGTIGKPNYFLSRVRISQKEDRIGGERIYHLICSMNEYHKIGYFLDTWKEVLLQAELSFVSELFAESQMGLQKMLKMDIESFDEEDTGDE